MYCFFLTIYGLIIFRLQYLKIVYDSEKVLEFGSSQVDYEIGPSSIFLPNIIHLSCPLWTILLAPYKPSSLPIMIHLSCPLWSIFLVYFDQSSLPIMSHLSCPLQSIFFPCYWSSSFLLYLTQVQRCMCYLSCTLPQFIAHVAHDQYTSCLCSALLSRPARTFQPAI